MPDRLRELLGRLSELAGCLLAECWYHAYRFAPWLLPDISPWGDDD